MHLLKLKVFCFVKVKSIYVEYLPSTWNEEKMRDYFVKFGEIESIALAKDIFSNVISIIRGLAIISN